MADLMPARDLVAAGLCSPACLIASEENGKCVCRCRGNFHGALAETPVRADGVRWWVNCDYIGWRPTILESETPIARSLPDENRLHAAARHSGVAATYVRRWERQWGVLWDGITLRRSASGLPDWPMREAGLLNRFVEGLLTARRINYGAVFPAEYVSLGPIRDLTEACVVWHVLNECWMGNPCGIVRAIEVIEGRTDPVDLGMNPEAGYPELLAAGATHD